MSAGKAIKSKQDQPQREDMGMTTSMVTRQCFSNPLEPILPHCELKMTDRFGIFVLLGVGFALVY